MKVPNKDLSGNVMRNREKEKGEKGKFVCFFKYKTITPLAKMNDKFS